VLVAPATVISRQRVSGSFSCSKSGGSRRGPALLAKRKDNDGLEPAPMAGDAFALAAPEPAPPLSQAGGERQLEELPFRFHDGLAAGNTVFVKREGSGNIPSVSFPRKQREPASTLETSAATEPFSTFSLHVSDVSFKLAQSALAKNEWPDKESVRIEEFVNAFDYGDPSPGEAEPVVCQIEQAAHPFAQQRNLVRFGIRTAAVGRGASTPLRLTVLLDSSGSMERPDRHATVAARLRTPRRELRDGDEITLIAFARQPRLVAEGANRDAAANLAKQIAGMPSEGGTNLEAALVLAGEKARANRSPDAQNRIVLITDGAANLGMPMPPGSRR